METASSMDTDCLHVEDEGFEDEGLLARVAALELENAQLRVRVQELEALLPLEAASPATAETAEQAAKRKKREQQRDRRAGNPRCPRADQPTGQLSTAAQPTCEPSSSTDGGAIATTTVDASSSASATKKCRCEVQWDLAQGVERARVLASLAIQRSRTREHRREEELDCIREQLCLQPGLGASLALNIDRLQFDGSSFNGLWSRFMLSSARQMNCPCPRCCTTCCDCCSPPSVR